MRKTLSSVFPGFLWVVLLAVQFSCQSQSTVAPAGPYYKVSRIVDGDTFYVTDSTGKQEKIRLIGIDAPESHRSQHKEIQYYGKEAAAYLTQLLEHKKVKLVPDVAPRDKYHRTLAYVYLENGLFVNADLIKNGYATVLTVPPNVKHADLFVGLQKEARKNKRGLWRKRIN